MILKLFTKKDCPRCPAAKEVVEKLSAENRASFAVERYDTESVDGMAEAAFYSVMATPTILLCDGKGKEVAGWRGASPSIDELRKVLH